MSVSFSALSLQEEPAIYLAILPGRWLFDHTTPSWRIKDPRIGFQRMVNEKRAHAIAAAVLDQKRSFPNAIVLATDSTRLTLSRGSLTVPKGTRFLVVDGQHRLYAQQFSEFDMPYACLIHVGLSERDMAELFVEINDNQKRVPSSLRWDLVRLVRPDETDPAAVRAVDLVYDLVTERDSVLRQRVDLTGEQPRIELKQGSLAPEIRKLVSEKKGVLADIGYDQQLELLKAYFSAIRECDPDGWHESTGNLYGNRVLRALLQLLPDVLRSIKKATNSVTARDFYAYLRRIKLKDLDAEKIRAVQGSSGIAQIRDTIRKQILH